MRDRPVLHGRDHGPGGADPTLFLWDDVGSGGSGGGGAATISHVDLVVTDGLFWWRNAGAATLAAGGIGFINFPTSNLPLVTNDTATFTLDQYTGGNLQGVYGLGVHAIGTYNFYCCLTANASAAVTNPWQFAIPYQFVNLVNDEWAGPDQSGQYMTYVPTSSTGGFWQAIFMQRVIVNNDTNSGSGGPSPFTLEIDNLAASHGGFTLGGCYACIAVDKIAGDTGGG
jgi:hypothetical protein